MDFKIISKTEGAAVIDNGINKFLAINSGLKNKAFVGVDTSKLQSLPGLIIENGEIHNWKLEGITEIDGITYYFGPYLEGKTLPELDLNPHILLELTAALHIIKDRKFPVRQFSLSSVFCTDDGRILFFPPHLMDFLNTHRKRQNSLKMIEPWNNPKLGGNEGRSFTIAALAYKSLTGEIPFAGESEEDIDKLISKKNYRSPLMVEPLLKKEIYSLIDDSFDGKGTLRLWRDVLTSWKSDGAIDRSLSMKDKEDIVTAQRKVDQKRIQRAKVSDFFFKNKTKLIVAIAFLGIAFTLIFWGRFKVFHVVLYIAMGWLIVFIWKPVTSVIPLSLLKWIIAGGLTYTVGTIFYAMKKLPFYHAIWHVFVLGGSIFFFLGIYMYIPGL